MAIITTRYDTKTKAMTVDVDGVELADVTDVYFGKHDREAHCEVRTSSKSADDIRTITHLVASEHGLTEAAAPQAPPVVASDARQRQEALRQAIAAFVGRE